MRCQTKKVDILPLVTLVYDESTISDILNILQKLTQVFNLSKEIVHSKVIMLNDDLLIVRNAMQTIYKRQNKPTNFHQFGWLELITGLFHLQINVLKFIFEKL